MSFSSGSAAKKGTKRPLRVEQPAAKLVQDAIRRVTVDMAEVATMFLSTPSRTPDFRQTPGCEPGVHINGADGKE